MMIDDRRFGIAILALHFSVWVILPSFLVTGLHTDTLEIMGWAQHLALGYPKHPPVANWIMHFYGQIVPLNVITISCLAQSFVVLSGLFVWQSARLLTTERNAVVALILLLESASATFWTSSFNHNLVMLPFAAAAFYFSLAYFVRPNLARALLAGLSFGLGFLAKYEIVIVLIVVLALSVLPEYRKIWRQKATYAGIIFAALVVMPHLVWDHAHDWQTLKYAEDDRRMVTLYNGVESLLDFLTGIFIIGFGPAIALILLAGGRNLRLCFRMDRMSAILAVVPLAALCILSLVTFQVIRQAWLLPVGFIVLIGVAASFDFSRAGSPLFRNKNRFAIMALTVLQAIVFHAMLVGKSYFNRPDKYFTFDTAGLARQADAFWSDNSKEPLYCIGVSNYRSRILNLGLIEPSRFRFSTIESETGTPTDMACNPHNTLVILEADDPLIGRFQNDAYTKKTFGIASRFGPSSFYIQAVFIRKL